MKALVAYYSRTGHTKRIAVELAATIGADLEELRDGRNRRGLIGFIMSGREAIKKQHVDLEPLQHDPAVYDIVIVGSPIWANSICSPVRTFLAQYKQQIKRAAWLCTSGSIDPKYAAKGFAIMTEQSGLAPVATLGMGQRDVKREHSSELAEFAAALRTADRLKR